MDKSKKILLISLIPAALTLIFVTYLFMPTYDKMSKAHEELEIERNEFKQTQTDLNLQKSTEGLVRKIQQLAEKLGRFDAEVPMADEDEEAVFFVDLEKFSKFSNTTISLINLNQEIPVDIVEKKKTDSRESSEEEKNKKVLPIELYSVPMQITISGSYPNILKFVNALEKYQRKVIVNSVSASSGKKDNKEESASTLSSGVEMIVDCNIYRISKTAPLLSNQQS